MFALAQALQQAQQSLPQVLNGALPSIESGVEAVRQSVVRLAPTGTSVFRNGLAIGQDLGVDVGIQKVDPAKSLDPKTFSVDDPTQLQLKDDASRLAHVAKEKHEAEERRQREQASSPFGPMTGKDILPWSKKEPPMMKERERSGPRLPLMKF